MTYPITSDLFDQLPMHLIAILYNPIHSRSERFDRIKQQFSHNRMFDNFEAASSFLQILVYLPDIHPLNHEPQPARLFNRNTQPCKKRLG